MQSSIKKSAPVETTKAFSFAKDETPDKKQEKMNIIPNNKIVKNEKLEKSTKDIRKRITTKYRIIEQIIPEKKTTNEVILNKYVTVTNNITQQMLTYHHWTGKHVPTTFVVSIDGVILKEGETRDILPNEQNEIVIRYDYSFVRGYKTGSREIYFSHPENKDRATLTFSWHTSSHLILEELPIVRDVVVPFNKNLEL